jgi:hypothetical protein
MNEAEKDASTLSPPLKARPPAVWSKRPRERQSPDWRSQIQTMNETETRAEHVYPAPKAAGWGVVEASRILREYPITLGRIERHERRGIRLTVDSVLVYRNHKLAAIEPK